MKFTFRIEERSRLYVDVEGDNYSEAEAELNRMFTCGEVSMDECGEYESTMSLVSVEC